MCGPVSYDVVPETSVIFVGVPNAPVIVLPDVDLEHAAEVHRNAAVQHASAQNPRQHRCQRNIGCAVGRRQVCPLRRRSEKNAAGSGNRRHRRPFGRRRLIDVYS